MRFIVALVLLYNLSPSYSQDHSFPFGATNKDLSYPGFPGDTAAAAVVLNEFGEAYIDNYNNHYLLFEYHTRIKILKKSGLKYADIEIPLYRDGSMAERIISIRASSFNFENGTMREVKLDDKNIYTENKNKYLDIKKFAIPDVREGSVIEFAYTLESPYIFKFRNWDFQSDIPKVRSEYWALIPGNYVYNTTLSGYLRLTKNESSLIQDCFQPGGGNKADCGLYKYAMINIPAFREEDYMTARSNHISAINFELSEIRHFDGRVAKYTEEWRDAELKLKRDPKFGVQLRKGDDIVGDDVKATLGSESDPLKKAQKIYDFIKYWYRWNGYYDKYSEFGIKKAFEKKSGNVGDINLSLVAALKFAGLDVEPVLLSTRENGLPIEIHPVLSDFNYVIAKLNLGNKNYLLDATDDFLPFGMLPMRCLNGKGRVLGEKESYWTELKPVDKFKRIRMLNMKLGADGVIRGTVQTTFMGYEALHQRAQIYSHTDTTEYFRKLQRSVDPVLIANTSLENLDDFGKPLIQKFDFELTAADDPNISFLFSPSTLVGNFENPFKSVERLYPIDYGAPYDYTTLLTLEYPKGYELEELPDKVALSLPNSGGRFIYEYLNVDNKLTLNSSFVISRPLYPATEYRALKEFYARVIQAQNGAVVFRRAK